MYNLKGIITCGPLYSQLSLNGHLYKMDTSLRRTADTLKALNGHLWNIVFSEQYLKTEMYVLNMKANYYLEKQISYYIAKYVEKS